MTTPLFEYSNDRNLARIADALEAQLTIDASIQWQLHAIVLHLTGDRAALTSFLMASEPTVTPAAAAPAPADFDSAQYAFDTMMSDSLAALGNLTVTPAAADPGDEDDNSDDYKPRIKWAKYDQRSRELARLRTAAKHRALTAKTPEQRAAAIVERDQAKSEANKRQAVLRRLFYSDNVIDFITGELIVYSGAKSFTWRSEYLQAPDYILTLPE